VDRARFELRRIRVERIKRDNGQCTPKRWRQGSREFLFQHMIGNNVWAHKLRSVQPDETGGRRVVVTTIGCVIYSRPRAPLELPYLGLQITTGRLAGQFLTPETSTFSNEGST